MGLFGRRKDEIISPTQAPKMATLNGVPLPRDAATHASAARSPTLPKSPRVKGSSVPSHGASSATTEPAFVLPVEDVFVIPGRGAVVTGTVATGIARQGSAVVTRQGARVARGVITGIEVNRRQVEEAHAGSAVGLLVRGLQDGQVRAGDVLQSA